MLEIGMPGIGHSHEGFREIPRIDGNKVRVDHFLHSGNDRPDRVHIRDQRSIEEKISPVRNSDETQSRKIRSKAFEDRSRILHVQDLGNRHCR